MRLKSDLVIYLPRLLGFGGDHCSNALTKLTQRIMCEPSSSIMCLVLMSWTCPERLIAGLPYNIEVLCSVSGCRLTARRDCNLRIVQLLSWLGVILPWLECILRGDWCEWKEGVIATSVFRHTPPTGCARSRRLDLSALRALGTVTHEIQRHRALTKSKFGAHSCSNSVTC